MTGTAASVSGAADQAITIGETDAFASAAVKKQNGTKNIYGNTSKRKPRRFVITHGSKIMSGHMMSTVALDVGKRKGKRRNFIDAIQLRRYAKITK